jgi:hypothetical protein
MFLYVQDFFSDVRFRRRSPDGGPGAFLRNFGPELDPIDFAPQIPQGLDAADDLVERFLCFGRRFISPCSCLV